MPKKPKLSPALRDLFREYLRAHLKKIGAKGGRASAGRAVRNWWAAIPSEERSRIMRERAKKRAKARKKRTS